MNKKLLSLLIAAGFVLGASQAFSSPVNITVSDNDPVATTFGGGPFNSNPLGTDLEDNETEHYTVPGQVWDLEAFVVDGTTLYLVGGYDFQAGTAGQKPGDLFIKVGGTYPGFAPTTSSPAIVNNAAYGYDYAVDLSQPVGATGATASAYVLNPASLFNTVTYDDRGANPWRFNSGGWVDGNRPISYTPGLADGSAALVALGLGHLQGGSHNILAIDLSFLSVASGTAVYFSYTMECGNDSLKGQYEGGFDRVPDETASALLIGLGLAAMSLVGLKRRQS